MDSDFQPPLYPPPLLTEKELAFLSFQGWLPVRLPVSLIADLEDVTTQAAKFFESNDLAQKKELYPPRNGTECGYYRVEGAKEYVTFRHMVHEDSALDKRVQSVWRQASSYLHRILCDLSRAYGIDIHAWDSTIDGSLTLPPDAQNLENIISLMRLFQYFSEGVADQHTDVGLLTLCVGDVPGLEVVDHSNGKKRWLRVKWPVVLVGRTATALLNERVKAGIHRVVKNPEGRSSTVFALRPRLKGQIDLSRFGGDGIVDAGDFFRKVRGDGDNINATQAFRDNQRRTREAKQKQDTISASGYDETNVSKELQFPAG